MLAAARHLSRLNVVSRLKVGQGWNGSLVVRRALRTRRCAFEPATTLAVTRWGRCQINRPFLDTWRMRWNGMRSVRSWASVTKKLPRSPSGNRTPANGTVTICSETRSRYPISNVPCPNSLSHRIRLNNCLIGIILIRETTRPCRRRQSPWCGPGCPVGGDRSIVLAARLGINVSPPLRPHARCQLIATNA